MSMQSRQHVWRSVCRAHDAYSPVLALRAAFGTSASFRKDDEQSLPIRETPTAQPLKSTQSDHQSIAGSFEANAGENTDPAKPETPPAQTNKRKLKRLHDSTRGSGSGTPKDGRNSGYAPPSKRTGNTQRPANFVNHKYWEKHMARVRECSFQVQHSQWWEDERTVSLQPMKRFLDYDAKIVLPEPTRLAKPSPIPWAMDENGRRDASVNSCLASDIEAFAAWVKPTPDEQRARGAVAKEMEELIRSTLTPEETGVELFGSEKNGIALPLSDIDIRIFDKKDPAFPHTKLAPRLRKICAALHASDRFMLGTVRSSTHPILNCQHRESGLDIQIVAANDAKPQQEVIAKYIQKLPQLREIYFVVRTMLSMRGLVDVFHGGMGSYGTFVMVLAVLDRHMKHHKATHGSTANISSASQFIAFLEFYRKLEISKHGVAVHPRTLFKKHESTREILNAYGALAQKRGDPVRAGQWRICAKRPFQPYLLCLQDPADPFNDLGRKGHAIKHVHATLVHLNHSLAAGFLALKRWKQERSKDLSTPEPLLLPLVGRCHEVYYHRRKTLERYGKKLRAESVTSEEPEGGKVVRRVMHYDPKNRHPIKI